MQKELIFFLWIISEIRIKPEMNQLQSLECIIKTVNNSLLFYGQVKGTNQEDASSSDSHDSLCDHGGPGPASRQPSREQTRNSRQSFSITVNPNQWVGSLSVFKNKLGSNKSSWQSVHDSHSSTLALPAYKQWRMQKKEVMMMNNDVVQLEIQFFRLLKCGSGLDPALPGNGKWSMSAYGDSLQHPKLYADLCLWVIHSITLRLV